MNILLTSVGRRIYLVEWFKEALGNTGLLHVANSVVTPTFLAADKSVVSPLIYDSTYIDFILNYCVTNDIGAVISLFDIDLPVLSRSRDAFAAHGIQVLVSNPEAIELCNDKWKTYEFLKGNGIACPKTWLSPDDMISDLCRLEGNFPVIIKPRWGMGSIGVFRADDESELRTMYTAAREKVFVSYLKYESAIDADRCILIQELLEGQEYGLDVINDLDGRFVTTVVKKKLAMRAGETDSASVVGSDELFEIGRRLSLALKHRGNLDVDVFMTSEGPQILEMNARFGGGYPFSHLSGVNLPRQIVSWLSGGKTDPANFTHRCGVSFQKEITLRPLIDENKLPQVDFVENPSVLEKIIIELEGQLIPSLTSRNVDIATYASRLSKNGFALSLSMGDKTAGLIAGYANDMKTRIAYISFFAVASEYRGKGLGHILFRRFEVECAKTGMERLAFEVHKINNKAISFYYSLGCSIEKEKDRESWIMSKDIAVQKIAQGGGNSLSFLRAA